MKPHLSVHALDEKLHRLNQKRDTPVNSASLAES